MGRSSPDAEPAPERLEATENLAKLGIPRDEAVLLGKGLSFYQSLATGRRKPRSAAQAHFISVAHGELPPQTDHERAFIAYEQATRWGIGRELLQDYRVDVGWRRGDWRPIGSLGNTNPVYFARLPRRGESCALCDPSEAKRAALLFDRVVLPTHMVQQDSSIPSDLPVCCDRYDYDISDISFALAEESYWDEIGLGDVDLDEFDPEGRLGDEMLRSERFRELLDQGRLIASRDVWEWANLGVVPVLRTDRELRPIVGVGRSLVYLAALEEIPLVDEATPWEAIAEFRRDLEAVAGYRNLRMWVYDVSRATTTYEHALDLVATQLDRYDRAITKHGLQTRLGVLKFVISQQSLVSSLLGATLGALLASEPWGALVGGGLALTGSAVATVVESRVGKLDLLDAPGHEVAVIHQAKERFG